MRGKSVSKRKIQSDAKYNDEEIAKFINFIMERGKKTVAQRIVYGCFDIVKEKSKQDPRHMFNKALKQINPLV